MKKKRKKKKKNNKEKVNLLVKYEDQFGHTNLSSFWCAYFLPYVPGSRNM